MPSPFTHFLLRTHRVCQEGVTEVMATTADKEAEAALEAEAGVANPTGRPPTTANRLPIKAVGN